MRLTVLLSLLAYGLLLLGLASMQSAFVALGIPIVLFLAAGLLMGPDELEIDVRRTLSATRIGPGAAIDVLVTLTNRGNRLEEVHIRDLVPDGLEVEDGEPEIITSLEPGQEKEIAYTVRAPRGFHRFEGVEVVASDLFGILRRKATIATSDTLLVVPDAPPMRRVAIRPHKTHGYAGPVPARQSGAGIEFYGVREYQAGDPLRWINWRLTARHPRSLFTNEFEQERVADVGLILDARSRSNVTFQHDSLLEAGVTATASLAQAFLQDGHRVGLLIYGWYLDWTFPGYGKVQSERILRALARARLGESILFDTLDYLPVRYFPARSQLVVVSPLCADDYPMLLRLRARGYQVLVVSPDPVSFEERLTEPQPNTDLAVGMARVDRQLLLAKLRRIGIQVIDWDVAQPLDQTMRIMERLNPHLLHGHMRWGS